MLRTLGRRTVLLSDAANELWFRCTHRLVGFAHVDLANSGGLIDRAIDLGISFLERTQRPDGAWIDFRLPPGASNEWVTAHIAFVLEDIPAAHEVAERAADYLVRTGRDRVGWGYNQRVSADCDSTAQALMVLHHHGFAPSGEVVDWLISSQTKSGGFPTYPHERGMPATGWNAEHPDVTLLVVECLRRLGVAAAAQRAALEWLGSANRTVVTSYWWPSPSYAIWSQVHTSFFPTHAAAHAAELLKQVYVVPESAMLIEAAAAGGELPRDQAHESAVLLLGKQLQDGSWRCSPCLRVTEPTTMDSYSTAPGAIYAGARHAFSTAHAVAALNELTKGNSPY